MGNTSEMMGHHRDRVHPTVTGLDSSRPLQRRMKGLYVASNLSLAPKGISINERTFL